MNQSQLERNLQLDETQQTVSGLKLLKTDDADKIIQLDKADIIKYYEGILDKCHEVINQKREAIRQ